MALKLDLLTESPAPLWEDHVVQLVDPRELRGTNGSGCGGGRRGIRGGRGQGRSGWDGSGEGLGCLGSWGGGEPGERFGGRGRTLEGEREREMVMAQPWSQPFPTMHVF